LAGSPLLLRRAPVNTAKSLFFQIITAPLDDTILVSFTRRNQHLITNDGALDLAKYWFQKAIDCNCSGDVPKEDEDT
jgi:hypothetical protein